MKKKACAWILVFCCLFLFSGCNGIYDEGAPALSENEAKAELSTLLKKVEK